MAAVFKPAIPAVSKDDGSGQKGSTERGPGTRLRLLDAAAELFARRGYRGVVVRDVCERARAIGAGTLDR
ncbi:MAG: TetR family transcriptional regulator [Phycisphaeraceae bacterium]